MATNERALFLAEGTPTELDVLLLAEQLGPGANRGARGDLTIPFRSPNRFSIGEPVVTRLDTADSAELREQSVDYHFHQVQLTCSFQAASGCRFTEARFGVELNTEFDQSAAAPPTDGLTEAIAYDLFPLLLEDASTVTVTRTGATASFGFDQMGAKLSLPSNMQVEEEVRYSSRVEAFDLRGTRPAWSFHRTDQHEISGPQRLFMIVRKPRGSTVRATFSLHARVQFVWGGQGFSPVELVMLFRSRGETGVLTDEPTVALC